MTEDRSEFDALQFELWQFTHGLFAQKAQIQSMSVNELRDLTVTGSHLQKVWARNELKRRSV